MYEFLAPWGVVAPAVCAVFGYFKVGAIRRKQVLRSDDGPRDLGV